jgi:hypothetical protein
MIAFIRGIPDTGEHGLDAGLGEDLVHERRELPVPVADEVAGPATSVLQSRRNTTGHPAALTLLRETELAYVCQEKPNKAMTYTDGIVGTRGGLHIWIQKGSRPIGGHLIDLSSRERESRRHRAPCSSEPNGTDGRWDSSH